MVLQMPLLAIRRCKGWEHALDSLLLSMSVYMGILEYSNENDQRTGSTPGIYRIPTTLPDGTSGVSLDSTLEITQYWK